MRSALGGVIAALLLNLHVAAQTAPPEVVRIPSGDAFIFGVMFRGEGDGPRPTAVLLTGHPGVPVYAPVGRPENVLGLAEPLRRAGFNVLAIGFRGAWGSGGRYSILARIEDVTAAVAFSRVHAATYNADAARVLVVGWSMGGFNALVAGVEDPSLECTIAIAPANYGARSVERMRQQTEEPPNLDLATLGLSGFTGRDLRREILASQPRFDVVSRMEGLTGRPLLIVQAEQDETVPADDVRAYVDAARGVGAAPFDHVLIAANHAFNLEGNRSQLASMVVSWVTRNCN